jgi:hypothetical protein
MEEPGQMNTAKRLVDARNAKVARMQLTLMKMLPTKGKDHQSERVVQAKVQHQTKAAAATNNTTNPSPTPDGSGGNYSVLPAAELHNKLHPTSYITN